MARLNIDRQATLEPIRLDTAKKAISELGYAITFECKTRIEFMFKDAVIQFYPYSGWATGKTIIDGRGLHNLLKQIKNE